MNIILNHYRNDLNFIKDSSSSIIVVLTFYISKILDKNISSLTSIFKLMGRSIFWIPGGDRGEILMKSLWFTKSRPRPASVYESKLPTWEIKYWTWRCVLPYFTHSMRTHQVSIIINCKHQNISVKNVQIFNCICIIFNTENLLVHDGFPITVIVMLGRQKCHSGLANCICLVQIGSAGLTQRLLYVYRLVIQCLCIQTSYTMGLIITIIIIISSLITGLKKGEEKKNQKE